ncbi:MAG: aminotransferase class IV, partial [Halobacteriovoraceae bacterium]|nr:aminotransferase class IV [Halobacteriovoraceae bacterium]
DEVFGKKLSEDFLLDGIKATFSQRVISRTGNCSLRITLFEDDKGTLNFLTSLAPFQRDTKNPWERIDTYSYDHYSSFKKKNIKVGNYSESLIAHKNLLKPFIYLDSKEKLSEGPICNFVLFHEKEERWVTPVNEGKVLRGIGLKFGLEGLNIQEREISFSEKDRFSAMFAINALRGPLPVDVWDNRALTKSKFFEKKLKELFESNEEKWSIKL